MACQDFQWYIHRYAQASSRSHCVFSVQIRSKHPETTTLRSSKLHLVDLAGSERVYKSDAIAVGGSASGAASVAGDDASSVGGNSRAGSRSRAASGVDLSSGASVGSRGGRSAISVDRRSAVTAGSRRAFAPGAADGPTSALTRREGRFINLSLHYLEKVIIALQDRQTHDSRDGGGSAAGGATSARSGSRGRGGNSGHVPYRNSTLTAILKDSLGGNCRTAFLATLNPEPEFTDECISTCRFAQRCGMVTTRVQANATTDLAAVVASLRSENDRLNARVAQLGQIIVSLGVPLLPVPDEASGSAHAGGGTTPSRGAAAQHSGFGASSIPLRVQQITADDISRAQHGVAEFLKVGLQSGTADRGVTPHDSMQAPAWYWIPGLNLPQMHIAAHLLRRAVVHASRAASAARQGAAGGGSTGPSSTPTPPTLPPPPSLEQVSPAPAAPAAQAVSGIPGGLPSSAPPRTSAEGGGSGVEASSAMSTPQRRAGVDDTDAAGAALRASAQSDRAVKRRLAAGRSVSAEEILPGSPSHSVQPVDNAAGTIVARSPLPIAQLSQQQSLGMQSARQLVRPKHPTLGDGSVAEAPFSSPGAASPDRLAHTEADTDPSQAFRRLLVKGAVFQKSSKKGLRRRFVHVSPDLRILFWRPVQSSKIQGACDVRAVLGVVKGAATVSAGFTDGGLGMEAVSVTADDTAVSLVTRDGKVITLFVELPAGSTHFDDLDAAMQSAVRQARNVWADAFTSITTAENTTIPSNESVHEVRSFTTADAAVGLRDENSSQLSPSQTASERSWV